MEPKSASELSDTKPTSYLAEYPDPSSVQVESAAPPPIKHFSTLALVGLSFAILNSWSAACQALNLGLGTVGPNLIYCLITGTLGALTIAVSLAEICHVFPSVGGQYHWAYAMAPPKHRASVAYYTGFLGTTGWIALTCSVPYYGGATILGLVQTFNPDFVAGVWLDFVIYVAIVIWCCLVNVFGAKYLDAMNKAAIFWSLGGAVIIFVVCLACPSAQNHRSSGKWVFATFVNSTGWPNGVAWLLGLLQAQFCLVGADGASHVIDEIDRPHINAPKAMILACLIGGTSATLVLLSILFGISDMDKVVAAGAAGIVEAFYQATQNKAATVCLLVLILGTLMFTGPALLVTCSRMVQAYANDGCLPYKNKLGSVSRRFQVPVWATIFCFFWFVVFGLIMFGSQIAISAIISSSVILLQLSYVIPIGAMIFGGRKRIFGSSSSIEDDKDDEIPIPTDIKYTLGKVWGPVLNIIALCYILVTSVFFLFPGAIPVTSGSFMNYSVVVVFGTFVFAFVNWLLFARKTYKGPHDFRAILERAHLRRAE